MKKQKFITNEAIRVREVRVVSAEGNMGVLPIEKALQMAKEKNLDLVLVTSNANPPVCKIVDYGKFIYDEKKKKSPGKTSKPQVKTIRLGFSISEHDMETKARSVIKFLEEGDTVRIVLPLRGRQKALQDVAKEKIKLFLNSLAEKISFKIEKEVGKEPRGLTVTITKS